MSPSSSVDDLINQNIITETTKAFGYNLGIGSVAGYSLGWWVNAEQKQRFLHGIRFGLLTG